MITCKIKPGPLKPKGQANGLPVKAAPQLKLWLLDQILPVAVRVQIGRQSTSRHRITNS
jgi:hypothetical protein